MLDGVLGASLFDRRINLPNNLLYILLLLRPGPILRRNRHSRSDHSEDEAHAHGNVLFLRINIAHIQPLRLNILVALLAAGLRQYQNFVLRRPPPCLLLLRNLCFRCLLAQRFDNWGLTGLDAENLPYLLVKVPLLHLNFLVLLILQVPLLQLRGNDILRLLLVLSVTVGLFFITLLTLDYLFLR